MVSADWRLATMRGTLTWDKGSSSMVLFSELSPTLIMGHTEQGGPPVECMRFSSVASVHHDLANTVTLEQKNASKVSLIASTPEEARRWLNTIHLVMSRYQPLPLSELPGTEATNATPVVSFSPLVSHVAAPRGKPDMDSSNSPIAVPPNRSTTERVTGKAASTSRVGTFAVSNNTPTTSQTHTSSTSYRLPLESFTPIHMMNSSEIVSEILPSPPNDTTMQPSQAALKGATPPAAAAASSARRATSEGAALLTGPCEMDANTFPSEPYTDTEALSSRIRASSGAQPSVSTPSKGRPPPPPPPPSPPPPPFSSDTFRIPSAPRSDEDLRTKSPSIERAALYKPPHPTFREVSEDYISSRNVPNDAPRDPILDWAPAPRERSRTAPSNQRESPWLLLQPAEHTLAASKVLLNDVPHLSHVDPQPQLLPNELTNWVVETPPPLPRPALSMSTPTNPTSYVGEVKKGDYRNGSSVPDLVENSSREVQMEPRPDPHRSNSETLSFIDRQTPIPAPSSRRRNPINAPHIDSLMAGTTDAASPTWNDTWTRPLRYDRSVEARRGEGCTASEQTPAALSIDEPQSSLPDGGSIEGLRVDSSRGDDETDKERGHQQQRRGYQLMGRALPAHPSPSRFLNPSFNNCRKQCSPSEDPIAPHEGASPRHSYNERSDNNRFMHNYSRRTSVEQVGTHRVSAHSVIDRLVASPSRSANPESSATLLVPSFDAETSPRRTRHTEVLYRPIVAAVAAVPRRSSSVGGLFCYRSRSLDGGRERTPMRVWGDTPTRCPSVRRSDPNQATDSRRDWGAARSPRKRSHTKKRRHTSATREGLEWGACREVLLQPHLFTKHAVQGYGGIQHYVCVTQDMSCVVCIPAIDFEAKGSFLHPAPVSLDEAMSRYGADCRAMALSNLHRVSLGSEEDFVRGWSLRRLGTERILCLVSQTHAFLLEADSGKDALYFVHVWKTFLNGIKM